MSGKPRLKVLIVASWYPRPSSPQHGLFIRQQAEALSQVCDVAVLHVLQGEGPPQPQVAKEGQVTVVRVGNPLPKSPSTRIQHLKSLVAITLGYRRACRRGFSVLSKTWGSPDIVHGHAAMPAAIGARVISRRAGVPYVLTEHQAEFLLASPGFSSEGGRLVPTLMKRSMRQASAMIAVSSRLAHDLAAGGYHQHPVVVPNIVPGVEADPAPLPATVESTPLIVHVSLLRSYEKNLPMLLDALALVDRRGRDFQFCFVGDGPDRADLEALATELGLQEQRIRFVGAKSTPEVHAVFSESSFSVVSSRYETFCMVAAESLAAGRPVVCTRCGGPEDFVDDTVGVLVPNDDVAAMAEAIESMIDRHRDFDPVKLNRHVRDRFSADVVVARILDIYRDVLASVPGTRTRSEPKPRG